MLRELLRTVKTHLKVYRKKALDLNELHQPFPSKQEQVSIAKFLLSFLVLIYDYHLNLNQKITNQ